MEVTCEGEHAHADGPGDEDDHHGKQHKKKEEE